MADSPWDNVKISAMLVTVYRAHLKESAVSFGSPCYPVIRQKKPASTRAAMTGAAGGLRALQRMQFQEEEKNSSDQRHPSEGAQM